QAHKRGRGEIGVGPPLGPGAARGSRVPAGDVPAGALGYIPAVIDELGLPASTTVLIWFWETEPVPVNRVHPDQHWDMLAYLTLPSNGFRFGGVRSEGYHVDGYVCPDRGCKHTGGHRRVLRALGAARRRVQCNRRQCLVLRHF